MEEDRLEDSVEDLGAAGGAAGALQVGPLGAGRGRLSARGSLTLCPGAPFSADDFLEPEEYVEPEGAEPGEDADMGRSGSGLLARGAPEDGRKERGSWLHFCRSGSHASVSAL